MARVKALPQDYQIVYKEMQKYLFKVGPVELAEVTGLLSGIIDLFEEGTAKEKGFEAQFDHRLTAQWHR